MKRRFTLTGMLLLMLLTGSLKAATFSWVEVGDVGNLDDSNKGRGSVSYRYSIGKYEVTKRQYAEFLNAKAKADAYGLFNGNMATNGNGGIVRTGASGSYKYMVPAGQENFPVVFVSAADAKRFCNWVHNGMGSGDTEKGAYDLSFGTGIGHFVDALVWLPTQDEWHKAALYDPRRFGGAGGYYLYPTQSDAIPGSRRPSNLPNSANFYAYDGLIDGVNDGFAAVGRNYFYTLEPLITPVGGYSGSASYYGTFDQGGNVAELIEDYVSPTGYSYSLGGGWWNTSSTLSGGGYPTYTNEDSDVGFRLSAIAPPLIDDQPVDVAVLPGDPATFSTSVTGLGLKYQWRKNGVNIPGATSSAYHIDAVTLKSAGTYSVVITNFTGSKTSNGARLVVVTPPVIVTQPVTKTVVQGKSTYLAAVVTGTLDPAVVQWQKDAVDVPGGNGLKLTIPDAQPSDEGIYTLSISNAAGSTASDSVMLKVVVPPITNTGPVSLIVPLGEPTVQFDASFDGTPGTFQWKRGSSVVPGTAPTLNLTNVQLKDGGIYTVKSTNLGGYATTAGAELIVVDRTSKIIVQPIHGKAVFTAITAGPIPQYEWRKNGVPLHQVLGKTEGVTTKTLTIKTLAPGDTDVYTCMITGAGGSLETGNFSLFVTDGVPQLIAPIGFSDGMVGDAYSFIPAVVPGDSIQPSKFVATGLPRGLKINPLTGEIFGAPTVDGTFNVKVTASNPSGTGVSVTSPMVIQKIPEGAVGTFLGLLGRSALNDDLGGRLELTTTKGGTYSGKLLLGAISLPFSGGKLNIGMGRNDPNVVLIKRPRPKSPLQLTWTVDPDNNVITGGLVEDTADAGSNCAVTEGWRRVWTTTMLADAFVGQYNFTLENLGYAPGDLTQPGGIGYGSFKIASAKTGTLTITGRLADDTAFTMNTFVGPTGQVGLYVPLYTAKGSVFGKTVVASLGVAPQYADSSVNGTFSWLKKPQPLKVRAYTDGFGPIDLTAAGLKYVQPPPTANVLSTSVFTADLQFVADGLSAAALNPNATAFPLSLKNVATLTGHPAKTSLKIVASTGLFSGSFTLVDYTPVKVTRVVPYKGIIIRNSAGVGMGAGYSVVPQLSPSPPPSYSGSVELGATPP